MTAPRTKPDTGTAHTPDRAELERALVEAKANEIYSSQLMRRFRSTLSNVRDGLEDEGDRIYFGSTNDADELRAIIEEVEELEWDRILASSQKKPDLYARIRELNTEVRAARASQKDLLAALQQAKRLTDNINEFGSCTDSELYDAAWQAIETAIAKSTGAQS
jgi:hypothetical protein